MTTEFYDALGVPTDASPEEIKAAFRGKAKQYHPDAGGDPLKFGALMQAYDILSDPDKRARYDATGSTDTSNPADRIEAMARDRFASYIIDIVDSEEAFRKDWIKHAKGNLKKAREKVERDRKEVEAKIAKAEKLATRFKAKPEAKHSIPGDVLSHVKRDMARKFEEIKEACMVMDRFEQLIDDYSFEADPAPSRDQAVLDAQEEMLRNLFSRRSSTWG